MARSDFILSYQKSPIILTGGLAQNVPGGMLPIISLTQSEQFNQGILSGSSNLNFDDFLFDFSTMPGTSLIDNDVATYPFANQTVAANAIIARALHVSLYMIAPVRNVAGYQQKLSVFQSLKKSLDQHNQSGGTYTVVTPSYMFTNCILTSLRDASSGDASRPQDGWMWDFLQPLLTLAAAQQAQNALMQKISSGAKVTPDANGNITYSGQQPTVGNPSSGAAPSVVPAATPLQGTSVSGSQPVVGGVK